MNQPFLIYKLGPADAVRISASPDEPHYHEFEELIIGMKGKLEHFIDFQTSFYDAPLVSFVTRGKVHRVIPRLKNRSCSFWVIRFKSEFIPDTTFNLYTYYHDHANLRINPGECFNRMVDLCEMMHAVMQYPIPDYSIVKHLLSALFAMVESERKAIQPDEAGVPKTQNITFKNFLKILEENFRRPEGVEFYAERLLMSPRNLNLICQNILQKSVTEIIETRKLIEAKNLLVNTDKSVSEIGFELGYKEKAYFTTVFKKKSGQTPTEFREEMKRLVS